MRCMRTWVPIAAWLLLGAVGCGGSGGNVGGGGDSGGGGGPTGPPAPPAGNVTVNVTARDVFGTAVPGASIALLHSSGSGILKFATVTDADGRAEVTVGVDDVSAAIVSATDLRGISYELNRPAENRIDFDVTLHPESALSPGISRLSVSDRSADGRQLEFSARLYVVEGHALERSDFQAWNLGDVSVLACVSQAGSAADCVEGAAGFDASYEGSTLAKKWVDPDPISGSLAIALLLDQGASVAVTDPADRRLMAAAYLQTRLDRDDQVVLAAFAADNASTGEVALLPNQPVTIFPFANPAFTTDGRSYFPTIDSLATLEGGASPLHAALGDMIAFTASAAPADSRRAVIALVSGSVGDCGTLADCQAAQDALREQSPLNDVAIVTVGLSDSSGQVDRRKLGTFAQAEQGAVFWAQDPIQVATVFGRIPEILDGRHGAVDVKIRLRSPVAGAFASGHTVIGTLHVVVCPWECTESVDVPFALRVP